MPYDPMRHAADPDAAQMPRYAACCYEDALLCEMHIAHAADALSDVLAMIASKQDDMVWGADGYAASHAAAWDALVMQASDVAAAVLALKAKVAAA